MNKSELVETLSIKKNLTYKKSEQIVNLIFDTMSQALIDNERIEIRGFGSFMVKDYKAYMGRNPKTGEEIPISARRVVTFRPSQKLKGEVENNAIDK